MSLDNPLQSSNEIREAAAARGMKLGEDEIAALTIEEQWLRQNQQGLAAALNGGTAAPETYLLKLNELMEQYLVRVRSLLGVVNYARLFGGPSTDPGGIIEPGVFLREQGRSGRHRPRAYDAQSK